MKRPAVILALGIAVFIAGFVLAGFGYGWWIFLFLASLLLMSMGAIGLMYVGNRKKSNFFGRDCAVSNVRDPKSAPSDTPADIWDRMLSGEKTE